MAYEWVKINNRGDWHDGYSTRGIPIYLVQGLQTVNFVEERLDRAMVTLNWWQLFPHATMQNLYAPISYHTPIFLRGTLQGHVLGGKNFWFENMLLTEPELSNVVRESRLHSNHVELVDKLGRYAQDFE